MADRTTANQDGPSRAVERGHSNQATSQEHATGEGRRQADRAGQGPGPTAGSEENPRVLYADASLKKHDDRATAVATSIDKLIVSASRLGRQTLPLRKTLALVQPSVDTVVTDSKSAYGSFRTGGDLSRGRTILSKHKPPGRAIELVWVPAHSKVEGNALADHHARELSIRAEDEPASRDVL